MYTVSTVRKRRWSSTELWTYAMRYYGVDHTPHCTIFRARALELDRSYSYRACNSRNCATAHARAPGYPIRFTYVRHDVSRTSRRIISRSIYHTRARRAHALFVHIVQTTRTPTCFFTRPGAQTRPNITRRVVAVVEVWASLLFLRFFRATIKQHVWLAERTVRMLQRLQHL